MIVIFVAGSDRTRGLAAAVIGASRCRELFSAAEAADLDQRAHAAKWFLLVNGGDLYLETEAVRQYAPEEQKTFHAFHTATYMKTLFPEATILPPANNEMQHCCIIRSDR